MQPDFQFGQSRANLVDLALKARELRLFSDQLEQVIPLVKGDRVWKEVDLAMLARYA